jgi:hypothetical protein
LGRLRVDEGRAFRTTESENKKQMQEQMQVLRLRYAPLRMTALL